MKTLLCCLGILLLGVVHSFAQNKFSTYNNERFVYSIEYPSDLLKMQPPPENGDGRLFESEDGAVRMLVWGQYNALERTWNEEYEFDLKGFGSKPTYTIIKPDWFVISGIKDGKIFYQKTLRRTMHQKLGRLDVFYTFTIEYPKSKKSKFDAMVEHIANSFSFDPNAEV